MIKDCSNCYYGIIGLDEGPCEACHYFSNWKPEKEYIDKCNEAISNLNHIYGMVAPDIQRSLDMAITALKEKLEVLNNENTNQDTV